MRNILCSLGYLFDFFWLVFLDIYWGITASIPGKEFPWIHLFLCPNIFSSRGLLSACLFNCRGDISMTLHFLEGLSFKDDQLAPLDESMCPSPVNNISPESVLLSTSWFWCACVRLSSWLDGLHLKMLCYLVYPSRATFPGSLSYPLFSEMGRNRE